MTLDPSLLEKVISLLLSSGGEFADLYYQDVTARQMEAESGQIERISTIREKGVGLRLIRQGVTVFFVRLGDDLSAALTQPLAVAPVSGP